MRYDVTLRGGQPVEVRDMAAELAYGEAIRRVRHGEVAAGWEPFRISACRDAAGRTDDVAFDVEMSDISEDACDGLGWVEYAAYATVTVEAHSEDAAYDEAIAVVDLMTAPVPMWSM